MANLARLRMIEELSGFLPVDKPAGIAFATVLKSVKRKFNIVKLGHGGALDPAASGLFVLLFGDANKFTALLMGADRSYEGTMRLGLKTDTCDIHGAVLEERPVPAPEALAAAAAKAMPEFKGDVFQMEPSRCTVRREGAAGYETADTGPHKPFLAHVYKFDILAQSGSSLPFSVCATKGLVVRALVDAFGDAVGCGASLESLRRVKTGKIDISGAIPFDKLLDMPQEGLLSVVKPASAFLF